MSLMIDKYEHLDDAHMRLNNTVVLYKGDPVYIAGIDRNVADKLDDGIFRVYIHPLPIDVNKFDVFERARLRERAFMNGEKPPRKPDRKMICSKYFDIAPFRMGYINTDNGAAFCSRLPNRMQRQGLCGENFSGIMNDGTPYGFHQFTKEKNVNNMVHNDYPTFSAALKHLAKFSSVAFSRDFSVQKTEKGIDLYYKGRKVGVVDKGEGKLDPSFRCLQEVFDATQETKGWL